MTTEEFCGRAVRIDGERVEDFELELPAGVSHVIQVGKPDGDARFGREFDAPKGRAVNIELPKATELRSDWRDATICES